MEAYLLRFTTLYFTYLISMTCIKLSNFQILSVLSSLNDETEQLFFFLIWSLSILYVYDKAKKLNKITYKITWHISNLDSTTISEIFYSILRAAVSQRRATNESTSLITQILRFFNCWPKEYIGKHSSSHKEAMLIQNFNIMMINCQMRKFFFFLFNDDSKVFFFVYNLLINMSIHSKWMHHIFKIIYITSHCEHSFFFLFAIEWI